MVDPESFSFLDPGPLVDGDLELRLVRKCPPDPYVGYAPFYQFEMRRVVDYRRMGSISLRIGGGDYLEKYCGHIGYGVAPPYRGRRYAARACRLILPLAFRHGLEPVWITCNPENTASRRTCEIAGGILVGTVRLPEDIDLYRRGERYKCRYRIDS